MSFEHNRLQISPLTKPRHLRLFDYGRSKSYYYIRRELNSVCWAKEQTKKKILKFLYCEYFATDLFTNSKSGVQYNSESVRNGMLGGHFPIFISVINQLDAQNFRFTISLFHASTCFEHMCSKHVEAWNKLIVNQKFCASSWLITEINILRCMVSKTSKFPCLLYEPNLFVYRAHFFGLCWPFLTVLKYAVLRATMLFCS